MSNPTRWLYKVVDLSDNSTTVHGAPTIVGKMWFLVASNANINLVKDGTVTVHSIPISQAITATITHLEGTFFGTSLIIDAHDDATGQLVVQYMPA